MTIYKHVKSGGLYVLEIQNALLEVNKESVVVYRSLETNQVWVRPHKEFFDGRFVEYKNESIRAL